MRYFVKVEADDGRSYKVEIEEPDDEPASSRAEDARVQAEQLCGGTWSVRWITPADEPAPF